MIPEFSLCRCEKLDYEYEWGLLKNSMGVVYSDKERILELFIDYWMGEWGSTFWAVSPATELHIPGGLI